MPSEGKENVGVYDLITELCHKTASKWSQSKVSQKQLSAKMRSHAYEIILRKSKTEIPCCSNDPIKDLLSYHFMLQKYVKNVAEYKRSLNLKNAISQIRQTDFGEHKDCVYNTLKLLIGLRDSVKDDFSEQMFQNPFSFGLLDEMLPKPCREPYGSPEPYPYFPSYVFELPYSLKAQGAMLDNQRSHSHTEYTVETFDSKSFLPDKFSQHGSLETKTFLSPMSLASMTSTCLSPYSQTTLLNYPRLTAPRDLQIPSSDSREPNVKVSLASVSEKADKTEVCRAPSDDTLDIWELAALVDKDVPLDIWEHVSTLPPVVERAPIASSARELRLWRARVDGADLVVLPETTFIRHLMYLIIGVETSSFPFDESSGTFSMRARLALAGVSRARLARAVTSPLAAGAAYRRLQRRASCQRRRGLLCEAMREEIRKYLLKFRLAAAAPWEGGTAWPTLLQVLRHVEPLRLQIETVDAVYRILDTEGAGAALMSQLFVEVSLVTHPPTARLLYASLMAVANVYFKFIERFIFEGELDDEFGEFFIRKEPALVDARNKRYWDKGFTLAAPAVPPFLRPVAAAVLLCGKSLRLLRMCNPSDPVVSLISAAQPAVAGGGWRRLAAARAQLDVYRTRALYVRAGRPRASTVDDILAERRRLAQLMVSERQQLQRLRAARRRADTARDDRLREDERNKMMEYYSKLNMEVEKCKIHTEWKIKRLRLDQSRMQLLSTEERNLKREKLELEHQRNEAVMQMSIQSIDTKSEDDVNEEYDNNNGNNDNDNGNNDNNNGNNDNDNGNNDNGNNDNAPITQSIMTDSTQSVELKESPEKSSSAVNKNKAESSSDVFSAICNVAKSIFGVSKPKEETVCDNEVIIDSQGNVVHDSKRNANTNFSTSNDVIGANLNDAFDNQRYLEMRREALKNKDKVMSHEFGDTDNDNNEIKGLIKLSSVDEENNDEWTPYAEARRNKRKVLGAEFGLVKEETKVVTVEPRTEAQREALINKQKVMGVEYNLPVEIAAKKETFNVAQEEAVRNKNKILGSEYETGTKLAPKASAARKSSLTLNLKPIGETPSYSTTASAGPITPGDLFTGLDLETPTTADIPVDLTTGDVFTPRSEGREIESTPKPEKSFLTTDGFSFPLIVDETEGIENDSPEHSPSKISDMIDGSSRSVFNIIDGSYSLEDFDPFGVRDLKQFSGDYFTNKLNNPLKFYTHPAVIMEEVKKRPYDNIFSHYTEEEEQESCDDIASLSACLQRSVLLPLAYQLEVVNDSILTYFLVNLDMMEHLRCLKDYFFLMDGEFSRTICHNLFSRLAAAVNPQELFNYATLHAILDKALASSVSNVSSVSSNLSFTVSEGTVGTVGLSQSSPDALSGLALCYTVRWPLNVVLSREALQRYATVFQFLIKLKRIAWVLADDFQWLKLSARQHGAGGGGGVRRSRQLARLQLRRHAMASLVRALDCYLATSCLAAAWTHFREEVGKARTLDDLYAGHAAYVKQAVFRCLLNNRSQPVMRLLNDIFTVVLKFSRVLKAGEWQQEPNGSYVHSNFVQLEELFQLFLKLARYLHKVISKLLECGYQRHLAELLTLINLNGYYDHKD